MQFREQLKRAVDPILAKGAATKALLLSCIDLRYPHRITDTMDGLGYRGRYYHLAMAGASHAAKHDATWTQTFMDHLGFAVNEEETAKHKEVAGGVIVEIVKRYPVLKDNVTAMLLPKEPAEITPIDLGHA